MSTGYNIYRMEYSLLAELIKKIESVGLVEQKTITHANYVMTFYFSDKVKGNPVWWWDVFKDFFHDDIEQPSNLFNFGLLISYKKNNPMNCYLISLGKSHFYLNKFIEQDFGINVAMRIANDENILLKKSRYFCGAKSQEISSYQQFVRGAYLPGESVEHLKTKANEIERWGGNNITFADSIQLSFDGSPTELVDVFDDIDSSLLTKEKIEFPKSERIFDENIIEKLDEKIYESIINGDTHVVIDEMQSFGTSISISNSDNIYKLFTKINDTQRWEFRTTLISNLTMGDVKSFFDLNKITDINKVFVRISNEAFGAYTSPLKGILSFTHTEKNDNYFLKKGLWNRFNAAFMSYLQNSLKLIEFVKQEDLNETDFIAWQKKKTRLIQNNKSNDKIKYREYYFNEKMANDKGYTLLDRQLQKIESLNVEGKDYNIEVADLYKSGELISVKISDKPHDLIYNIEQSKSSIQTIKGNVISFNAPLTHAVLWISTTKKAKKIIDINSIQFLLAVQSWKELVDGFNLVPKIYYSYHNKPKKRKK